MIAESPVRERAVSVQHVIPWHVAYRHTQLLDALCVLLTLPRLVRSSLRVAQFCSRRLERRLARLAQHVL